ncbi:uncharacterized protein LOC117337347 [Pecten maximus]|uniref:uncharacterized protein LOC117337347 n=1 Tax=Pecten maximus TaxID=6579 RepID=UPI00145839EC|nr:uncharacterized protein LOC117337347 [Pecten maximus]
MVSKIQVESWILMHACKHKYQQVVKGILNRHHDNLDELDVPKIYLSIAMLYNIVTTDNVSYYPVVVNHLDFIYGEVPDAVPFKLYSKLSIGLKMKWAMELLKNSHDDTLMVLNNYFPRKGSHCKHAVQKELSCLHSAQKNFRKFFLPLLAHQNQREAYFRDEFEEEYGKHFLGALHQLAGTFVEKLTSLLPPTAIEKILVEGPEQYLPLLESSTHLSLEMLLDTLHGKDVLEENDLLDLLTMVSPLHTKDRVQVDKVWLLSSNESNKSSSKSLFSSHSDDQPTGLQHDSVEETSDTFKTPDCIDSNQNHITDPASEERCDTISNNITPLNESFGDFNDKRHLFHCNFKDSQNKQISKKDHERNSDNVESPKSSGESVSILSKKHMQTRAKTRDAR